VGKTALSAANILLKMAIGSRLRRYLQKDRIKPNVCYAEKRSVHVLLPPIVQPVRAIERSLAQHVLQKKNRKFVICHKKMNQEAFIVKCKGQENQ
jgi:hypothetical protein